jgi:Ca2+/H+ antiporter
MRLVALVWVLLIVVLSLIPLPWKDAIGTTGIFHRAGHLLAFLILAFLLCRMASSLAAKIVRCLGAVLLGIVLETVEHLLYRDRMEWDDVLVDTIGVAAGFFCVFALKSRTSPSKNI